MVRTFEFVMTCILSYMAYCLYEGHVSGPVMGLLILIQSLFWGIDLLLVRSSDEELDQMRRVARRLSRSMSRA